MIDITTPFTPDRKKSALENLRLLLQEVQAMPTVTPCQACDHFDSGLCRHWRADVPPDVQPTGCDHFVDRVPF